MSSGNSGRKGLAEKRQAIIDGARTVFARDGYTRASIDTIAKEAEVSSRTIYNHFADKKDLFRTIILESAAQVREVLFADMARHLDKILDLEADLLAFALDFTAPMRAFNGHFALVRHIQAEIGHFPPDLLEAWRDTGPRPVAAELARRLADLGERGLLAIEDPQRAAVHFTQLAAGEVQASTIYGALPISEQELVASVSAGVQVFLRAYRPVGGQ
ncbi:MULTISPECIES: TetR/AcrR family transcriptional regulator [unclassified Crossiella]|uniref:TetR/AcrR family transcriptional regulator C-terminal domain-containing protein n=1 Tax=unclassified Crossiella TaxID=2620835 RepID=UPI001FFF48ED|nr:MULTISPECIES: TetR/AcrR family transcriptional regulator [unclassified Crossiella]MCK2240614.1 TetR/AcrR family transcriptional regulator [Crossiella sp. S99.2]MCK2252935.1 TetR/AcrR family transcriptional regulator [Crossiella sp. S99.1]